MAKVNKTLFEYLLRIYELQINNQSGAVNSIEAKALQLLAGIGIFLPLALTLIINSTNIVFNEWILVGCATLLFCVICSGYVLWSKIFKVRPKISTFYEDNKNLSPNEMHTEALIDMNKAIKDNNRSLKLKGWAFNIQVICFCLSIFLIALGIIVQKVNFAYNSITTSMIDDSNNQQNQPEDQQSNQDNTIDWDSAKPSHDEGFFKGNEDSGNTRK